MSKAFPAQAALYLGLLLTFMVSRSASAQTAIIEKGAAKATIFINAKAPDSVMRAAGDLQSHLKQITDVEIPIVSDPARISGYGIYLGDTEMARAQGIRTAKLPDDGFRIIANRKWMVIAGNDYDGPPLSGFQDPFLEFQTYNKELKLGMFGNTGTMFGVNHFLEQYCGVRWYMPGEFGTVIPRRKAITIPAIDVQKSPHYPQRHVFYAYMDWFPEDMLWYRRAGFGSPAPVQVMHSFGPLFSKYKDTHPEYFALIDGKRDFTNLSAQEGTGNLNLSDPGLIQQAITDANKWFDDNPDQLIFPLCPPDGMHKISEDPVSQAQIDKSQGPAGEYSNYVWGFINKVAKGIQARHPDKFIGGFAYEKYAKPPTNIDKLEDNVVLVITKFRSQYPNPAIKKATDERIAGWARKVRTIYCWEYYCFPLFNRAWRGFPVAFTGLIQSDLRALKGVSRGDFIESQSWGYLGMEKDDIRLKFRGMQHLNLYVTARLLWNPDLDLKKLLSEYYSLFYGPAQKPMRGFWELVESNWNKKGWLDNPYDQYSGDTVKKLLAYLEQAKAKSAANSIYRKRVELLLAEFKPVAMVSIREASLPVPSAEAAALAAPPVITEGAPLPRLVNGPALTPFYDRGFNAGTPATAAQFAYDKDYFYVDVRNDEPAMDRLKLQATTRDSIKPGVFDDDCIEVFLAPNADKPQDAFHIVVNAAGVIFDEKKSPDIHHDNPVWDSNAKVTVRREANRWILRMAIPWTDFSMQSPQPGHKMKGNICRVRHAAGEFMEYGWAPVRHAAFYTPEDFGTITLGGVKSATQ